MACIPSSSLLFCMALRPRQAQNQTLKKEEDTHTHSIMSSPFNVSLPHFLIMAEFQTMIQDIYTHYYLSPPIPPLCVSFLFFFFFFLFLDLTSALSIRGNNLQNPLSYYQLGPLNFVQFNLICFVFNFCSEISVIDLIVMLVFQSGM